MRTRVQKWIHSLKRNADDSGRASGDDLLRMGVDYFTLNGILGNTSTPPSEIDVDMSLPDRFGNCNARGVRVGLCTFGGSTGISEADALGAAISRIVAPGVPLPLSPLLRHITIDSTSVATTIGMSQMLKNRFPWSITTAV